MKVGEGLKIDVSKIDKEKLYKGAKGTYLDATVFINIDEKDQYGDNGMITQSVPKGSQEKGAILGNCKVFWSDGNAPKVASSAPPPQSAPEFDEGSDVPF